MSLPHAILGLLMDRPMTGYDLKLLFDKELNSFWPAQMSQIYRELGNLEAKEWVDSRIEVQESRPDRKVYSITAAGKQVFAEWMNRFPKSLLSPCRDEFALRVFLGGRSSRDEMQFQLRRFIREKQSEIATFTLLEKNYETLAKKKHRPGHVPANDHATIQYCGGSLDPLGGRLPGRIGKEDIRRTRARCGKA